MRFVNGCQGVFGHALKHKNTVAFQGRCLRGTTLIATMFVVYLFKSDSVFKLREQSSFSLDPLSSGKGLSDGQIKRCYILIAVHIIGMKT